MFVLDKMDMGADTTFGMGRFDRGVMEYWDVESGLRQAETIEGRAQCSAGTPRSR